MQAWNVFSVCFTMNYFLIIEFLVNTFSSVFCLLVYFNHENIFYIYSQIFENPL